ncbi:hypothetical protein [Micromonospora sp. NBRC 107095]|nr:hypothetical protein [Micromonospora sp. NBRC 107095]
MNGRWTAARAGTAATVALLFLLSLLVAPVHQHRRGGEGQP